LELIAANWPNSAVCWIVQHGIFWHNSFCQFLNSVNSGSDKLSQMHGGWLTRLRCAGLPSPQQAVKRAIEFCTMFIKPSLRRRRREGGRAKQRPGESPLCYQTLNKIHPFLHNLNLTLAFIK
jgi:hypothetical protein